MQSEGEVDLHDNGDEMPTVSSRRSPRLRHRVAWMYYVEEMTQSAIADRLGIGRITVGRMLSEARASNEVRIALTRGLAELTRAEIELEKKYGVQEAIVAPLSTPRADPAPVIAAATGNYISELLRPNMKLGLGWGETLLKTLPFLLEDRKVPGLSVVSLLGGISRAQHVNPAEFASRFARIFLADCYLLAAPAVVDSPETKKTLVERCGLSEVFELAETLDAVVVSVGQIGVDSTASQYGAVSKADNAALRDAARSATCCSTSISRASWCATRSTSGRCRSRCEPLPRRRRVSWLPEGPQDSAMDRRLQAVGSRVGGDDDEVTIRQSAVVCRGGAYDRYGSTAANSAASAATGSRSRAAAISREKRASTPASAAATISALSSRRSFAAEEAIAVARPIASRNRSSATAGMLRPAGFVGAEGEVLDRPALGQREGERRREGEDVGLARRGRGRVARLDRRRDQAAPAPPDVVPGGVDRQLLDEAGLGAESANRPRNAA